MFKKYAPLLLALACGSQTPRAPSEPREASAPADAPTVPFADASLLDATDAAEGSPKDAAPEAEAAVELPIRFAALGDTGTGDDNQRKVASGLTQRCRTSGCDFVLLLGDNFYNNGVASTSDPQWNEKFETPYANLAQPFYAVLGNHDYGGLGAGYELARAAAEVSYSSPRWHMPSKYYVLRKGLIDFFVLDTTAQMFGDDAAQRSDVAAGIQNSIAPWKIALGHHPMRSNGDHGNAGNYDGFPPSINYAGTGVKAFLETVVCGKVDLYLSGHDHSRQWIKERCGGTTDLIVSGAGAKTTSLRGTQESHFQKATLGFVYVVATRDSLTIDMVDETGATEFSRTIQRAANP